VASVGALPALSLVVGVLLGLAVPWSATPWLACGAVTLGVAMLGWLRGRAPVASVALIAGFSACGAANAAHARDQAIDAPLRRALDAAFGGFALASLGPGGPHAPLPARARIVEDAVLRDGFASLRVQVLAVRLDDTWRDAAGGVTLSISGTASAERLAEWRAGRTIEAPVTFRRPARYLNDGVADFERDLALSGTALFGTVKSALLVDVRSHGSWLDEAAAEARARIRRAVARWVSARDPTSGALVTAVLIGDRAAIADEVRERLQVSGTYHVIAISGGNIAVFVVIVSVLCRLVGLGPRPAALATLFVLLLYAAVVVSGPSVRRAVLVAVLYLAARAVDHRAPPWQAAAMACAGLLVVWPLDLRDVGFVLTFGAAGALLAVAEATRLAGVPVAIRWLPQSILASLAVEAVLLPVQAMAFGRVSIAGVVLNLVAVPAMTVAQLSGLLVVAADVTGTTAWLAGWVADLSVRILLRSASLAEAAPWLTDRAPPPAWIAVGVYYVTLGVAMRGAGRLRATSALTCLATGWLVAFGLPDGIRRPSESTPQMRLTMLDVGQGEALLLQAPAGRPLLIDTGGRPFGGGLDVGARVVAPALWARGVASLAALLITHGDPDHMGGAAGVLASLPVGESWLGIRVPRHVAGNELLTDLGARRIAVRYLRAGESMSLGGVRLRVLHPPAPDWERQRVRNDDSVVIEATYGDVAFLLLGDVSAEIERSIVPQLTPARVRILKVAHHGSKTSTSQALLDAWRPQLALVSAGRGNSFGHPARDVLERLSSAGVRVLRTDQGGELTVETDGRSVRWSTYRDVTQTVAITKSRSSGTITTGDRMMVTSTMAAPSIEAPRRTAPAVRVRRGMSSTPPVTCTMPVKRRNHWPRPICSKIRTHTPRLSNLPYPMKTNRSPTAMAGRDRVREPTSARGRDVAGAADSNMGVESLNVLDPDA
jgi:competence protein ComEC